VKGRGNKENENGRRREERMNENRERYER